MGLFGLRCTGIAQGLENMSNFHVMMEYNGVRRSCLPFCSLHLRKDKYYRGFRYWKIVMERNEEIDSAEPSRIDNNNNKASTLVT